MTSNPCPRVFDDLPIALTGALPTGLTPFPCNNQCFTQFVLDAAIHCTPDEVKYFQALPAQIRELQELCVDSGCAEWISARKNCLLFRSDVSDVARCPERTFIVHQSEAEVGPLNNWMRPREMRPILHSLYRGCMSGRVMYVIPFWMGPAEDSKSLLCVQITDSPYVVLNMMIMTKIYPEIFTAFESRDRNGNLRYKFVPCLHSVGYPLKVDGVSRSDVPWPCHESPSCRFITHFTGENPMVLSFGSGYGGNALLGKKCLALRIASVMARQSNWQAEHMFILKVTPPANWPGWFDEHGNEIERDRKYFVILGAFPSSCGKTNLVMVLPPDIYSESGYEFQIETIGDDIAWIFRTQDGRLWVLNPENGFFGVAPGTSIDSNPRAIEMLFENVIFTNVGLGVESGDIWFEDMTTLYPEETVIDWKQRVRTNLRELASTEKGRRFLADKVNHVAFGNARYTVPFENLPEAIRPTELFVPLDSFAFGGRRDDVYPLVAQAYNYNHGLLYGTVLTSKPTSAQTSTGEPFIRDPFAQRPFIGYHVCDYLQHWIDMARDVPEALRPKFFYVNWFRSDCHKPEGEKFCWPGFRHNFRVIEFMCRRVLQGSGQRYAKATPWGWVPDLSQEGSLLVSDLVENGKVTEQGLTDLLTVNPKSFLKEIKGFKRFFERVLQARGTTYDGKFVPEEIWHELRELERRCLQELRV